MNFILGSIIGVLAGFSKYLKTFVAKLVGIFFIRFEIRGPSLKIVVGAYVREHFLASPLASTEFFGVEQFVRPLNSIQLVAYQDVGREMTFYLNRKKPYLVIAGSNLNNINQDYGATTSYAMEGHLYMIPRFMGKPQKLIQDAIAWAYSRRSDETVNRFKVRHVTGTAGDHYAGSQGRFANVEQSPVGGNNRKNEFTFMLQELLQPVGWSINDVGQPIPNDPVNNLALSDSILACVREALHWRESAEWYRRRLIPWARGWLLIGAPGTGKTSLARALGQVMNIPIFLFDLGSMTNRDLVEAFERDIEGNVPCMLLIEDIDGIFHGRENVSGIAGGVSFDCFLNVIGGIANRNGMFLIITANNPDLIDPAIGVVNASGNMESRPGRVDRIVFMEKPDRIGLLKIMKRILPNVERETELRLLESGSGMTGAQFQEMCARYALDEFWSEGNGKKDVKHFVSKEARN